MVKNRFALFFLACYMVVSLGTAVAGGRELFIFSGRGSPNTAPWAILVSPFLLVILPSIVLFCTSPKISWQRGLAVVLFVIGLVLTCVLLFLAAMPGG